MNNLGKVYLPEKNEKVFIIYDGDMDGWGAAWIAHKSLTNYCGISDKNITLIEMSKSSDRKTFDFSLIEEDSVIYILDYNFDHEVIFQFCELSKKVIIIDHHKYFFPKGQEWFEDLSDILIYYVDINHSAAILSWQYFTSKDKMAIYPPEILKYIEDRDLWKWELENSKEINSYIPLLLKNINYWDEITKNWHSLYKHIFIEHGEAILAHIKEKVKSSSKKARLIKIENYEVPIVNSMFYSSEICEELLNLYPDCLFSVCFHTTENGHTHLEFRSRGDFDVSLIAKKFGGGGHKAAAGAITKLKF